MSKKLFHCYERSYLSFAMAKGAKKKGAPKNGGSSNDVYENKGQKKSPADGLSMYMKARDL